MLTVRHIKTKKVPVLGPDKKPLEQNGTPVLQTVPDLDAHDQEQVIWSVDVPLEVEAAGAIAIDQYVAAELEKPAASTSVNSEAE